MKKIIGLILCNCLMGLIYGFFNGSASTEEYTSFSEIMMNDGKLICNFTDMELAEYLKNVKGRKMGGVSVYEVNKNVDATYISNTLYSVENTGETDVVYDVLVEVETTNKVSFSASGSLNGSISGKSKSGIKAEIGSKCGVEVSKTTTTSRKEKQTMKLVVEGGSSAIIYLTGNMSITNGVAAYYIFFVRASEGGFEIVTLKNQYARVEKKKI